MIHSTPDSKELGAFLKYKRSQLDPGELGLPVVAGRRRTPGARREEVCLLAGIGMTWYTWLEQGRAINPSAQVINSLAQTLRLTEAEMEYARRLAGIPPDNAEPTCAALPQHGQNVLDAFNCAPAFAITRDWSIVGWNALYARFFPWVATLPDSDRNLLWLLWSHEGVRKLLADWDEDVRRFTATFRAYVSGHLRTEPVMRLIKRLEAASSEFARVWASHEIERFTCLERHFNHPLVGHLTLEAHQLALEDAAGIQVILYTASPGSPSAERLQRLRELPLPGADTDIPAG